MAEREPFSIVVSRGLWRGYDVLVEPPVPAHPLRHFRDHTDALEAAQDIAAAEGWPIKDRTEVSSDAA